MVDGSSYPRLQHSLSRDKITAEVVREDLAYDPLTGKFLWVAVRVGVTRGKQVGCVNKHGYVVIPLRRVQFHAHRLAWAHYFGAFPAGQIDHINGDKSDNRIANLRLASPSQNKANTLAQKNNSSKIKGVFFSKSDNKWIARIQKSGVRRSVGSFDTAEQAAEAYNKAAIEMFGDFANINRIANSPT